MPRIWPRARRARSGHRSTVRRGWRRVLPVSVGAELAAGMVAMAVLVATGPASASAPPAGRAVAASGPTRAPMKRGGGPVDVLYAGSLLDLMEQQLGPAFHEATGYTENGVAAGSQELASEIKGRTQKADVFISAAPAVNSSLEGRANGGWVSWFATFATSPLLLAYNPHSRFAKDLRTMPWWKVVTMHGFLLGRTDPAIDPKGVLALDALESTARLRHLPALSALARSTREVFPEQTLVGRLQAGQLDAGFFFEVEARAAKLPTVPLTGTKLGAQYTVTVLNGAPDPVGAAAFVGFMLGSEGRAILARNGLSVPDPIRVEGDAAGVPASLRSVLSGS